MVFMRPKSKYERRCNGTVHGTLFIFPKPIMTALYYEDYTEGWTFESDRRTVTDYDISAFVNLHGFLTPTFQDLDYATETEHYKGRIAPGLLTLCIAEGLLLQAGLTKRRGIFLMELTPKFKDPVRAGDTLYNLVTLKEKRLTSKPDRSIVITDHLVKTTAGATAISYTSTRMIKTRAFVEK